MSDGAEVLCVTRALRATGATLLGILGAVDLEDGATANLASAGFRFRTLFTASGLGL
jgi:orotate phosphoribosyltransferase